MKIISSSTKELSAHLLSPLSHVTFCTPTKSNLYFILFLLTSVNSSYRLIRYIILSINSVCIDTFSFSHISVPKLYILRWHGLITSSKHGYANYSAQNILWTSTSGYNICAGLCIASWVMQFLLIYRLFVLHTSHLVLYQHPVMYGDVTVHYMSYNDAPAFYFWGLRSTS